MRTAISKVSALAESELAARFGSEEVQGCDGELLLLGEGMALCVLLEVERRDGRDDEFVLTGTVELLDLLDGCEWNGSRWLWWRCSFGGELKGSAGWRGGEGESVWGRGEGGDGEGLEWHSQS